MCARLPLGHPCPSPAPDARILRLPVLAAERADALGDAGALSLESKMQVRATSHSGSHITSQSMLRSCVGLQRDVVNAVSRGCCTLGMPRRQFNASPDQT